MEKKMAVILYKQTDDGWIRDKFDISVMYHQIHNGWVTSMEEPEEELPDYLQGKTNEEIRALAKNNNVDGWKSARITTLVKELRELNYGYIER
jgi:hypothetical protein